MPGEPVLNVYAIDRVLAFALTNASLSMQYDDALEEQLAQTAMGKSFERSPGVPPTDATSRTHDMGQSAMATAGMSPSGEDGTELKPVDVDLNLVTNMLASFESQHGLPGPVTNMAGMLGLKLPPVPSLAETSPNAAVDSSAGAKLESEDVDKQL